MSIAPNASYIKMPAIPPPYPKIIDFLVQRFPYISEAIWRERISNGKVLDPQNIPISFETPYLPGQRLYYFREVEKEPSIPYQEEILFENEHLLVVAKPHFLPVTPGGQYVNECLLYRLRNKYNLPDLVPLHRLDKDTAGIVLFSKLPESRVIYDELFREKKIHKVYFAVCIRENIQKTLEHPFTIENHLEPADPRFCMKITEGEINAITYIIPLRITPTHGYFELHPITGKTHQLRVHLQSIGYPIMNDPYYPILQHQSTPDFSKPLQLLAKRISWHDPIANKELEFTTPQTLQEWPSSL